MGDLADYFMNTTWKRHDLMFSDMEPRIRDLEHRHALALAELERAHKYNEAVFQIAQDALDGWESLWRSDNNDGPPDALVDLRARLLMSSSTTCYVHVRERDAALEALSMFVGRGLRVLSMDPVKSDRVRGDVGAVAESLSKLPKIDGLHVAVLAPSTRFNPDLLERASTLLAEAYIEAKKNG